MFNKVAVLLFIVPAMVLATPFTACGNEPMPNNIQFPGCNNQVCELRRNSEVTATVQFTAPRASREAFATADIQVNGNWVTFSRNRPICANMVVGRCPLVAGQRYTYRNTARVPAAIPVGRRIARIRATDDNRQVIACVQIAVNVVA